MQPLLSPQSCPLKSAQALSMFKSVENPVQAGSASNQGQPETVCIFHYGAITEYCFHICNAHNDCLRCHHSSSVLLPELSPCTCQSVHTHAINQIRVNSRNASHMIVVQVCVILHGPGFIFYPTVGKIDKTRDSLYVLKPCCCLKNQIADPTASRVV